MMTKTDLTKVYKNYYSAKKQPEIIELGEAQYISITGTGDPSDKLFASKTQALYTMAYAIKFIYKEQEQDFVVAKLEGQWWFDETEFPNVSMADAPVVVPRNRWHYRLLIRMPDFVVSTILQKALTAVASKKQIQYIHEVSWYTISPQKVLQILHVGPFDKEPESLLKIANYSAQHLLQQNGLHHEIYLSDFRKTSPDKLRTILREPVK